MWHLDQAFKRRRSVYTIAWLVSAKSARLTFIAVSPKGEIYAADRVNAAVQKFVKK